MSKFEFMNGDEITKDPFEITALLSHGNITITLPESFVDGSSFAIRNESYSEITIQTPMSQRIGQ